MSVSTMYNLDTSSESTNHTTSSESTNHTTSSTPDQYTFDMQDDFPELNEDENLPDIKLVPVKEIQSALGNMNYEVIRKVLYRKYGLVVKDEEPFPNLYMITYNKPEKQSKKLKVNLTDEERALVSQYRGVILEKKTNRPVCYTFEKMERHF